MRRSNINKLYFVLFAFGFLIEGLSCSPAGFRLHSSTTDSSGTPDPLFGYQWFLGGTKISSSVNIDASTVWNAGNMGQNIRIAVVDPSSIYLSHADINENKDLTKSFNFLTPTRGTDTTLSGAGSHGTCVAGVIGAKDQNGKGVRGVSSRAMIAGRTTSGVDTDIFDALTYKYADTDVSSNSYGPPDDVAELNQYYNNDLFNQGITTGLSLGRSGLGTVYVWAAGNGRAGGDRSNYDGYASNSGVMSVCSVDEQGNVSYFSEPGSNLWVCAPGEDIPTTDYLGLKCGNGQGGGNDFPDTNYTRSFTGTSAAAPVVSGVVGLILHEASLQNKSLGWRDVKMIIAESATKSSLVSWQPTRIQFNDDYGFGIVNASAAVALVKNWTPVGNSDWTTKILGTNLLGPTSSGTLDDSGSYLSMKSFTIDNNLTENGTTIFNSTIGYIEYILLEVKVSHTSPGDLDISIVHTPKGGGASALSKITTPHDCYDTNGNAATCTVASSYLYVFGVTNFLGESAEGTWDLKIRDGYTNGSTGSVVGWRLKLYGH